ncbi:MAG: hypothetical protein HC856_01960 [Pseudanabaena sp. RU_4_16]|nr:hypothetical protein [Pseudanabaena sp. RU_4_16]
MSLGNQKSILVLRSTGKKLKPGGFKQGSQERDAKKYPASLASRSDLQAKIELRSFMTSIEQQGKIIDPFFAYEEFDKIESLEFYEEIEGYFKLHPDTATSEILNESEDDDELDGPDEDEDEEEEDEYDEDEDEDLDEEEEEEEE